MRQQRWWGVIATLLLIVIAYADRVNISVMLVNPEFLNHFGLVDNRAYQGTLMTAFLLGYGLSAMLLTPFLETLFGYRKGLTLSVVLWALFTAASPLVGSFIILLVVRAFLGVSEGPLFSLKTMYISDHFAANERGKPNAVSALGVSLGLVIGFPLVTFLMSHLGWALSFHVLALINLLVGLLLVSVFIHPRTTGVVQRSSESMMQRVCHTFILAWKTPMLGWIMLVEIATLSYLWGSSSWLPAYLTNERGFSIKQMKRWFCLWADQRRGECLFGIYSLADGAGDDVVWHRLFRLFRAGGLADCDYVRWWNAVCSHARKPAIHHGVVNVKGLALLVDPQFGSKQLQHGIHFWLQLPPNRPHQIERQTVSRQFR